MLISEPAVCATCAILDYTLARVSAPKVHNSALKILQATSFSFLLQFQPTLFALLLVVQGNAEETLAGDKRG